MTNEADIKKTFQSWTDLQKGIWDRWLESLEQSKGASPDALWTNGLEHWKESVGKTLDCHGESLEAWAKGMEESDDAPAEVKKWARDGVAMVEGWVDAERTLWNQWFELVTGASGSASAGQPMQVTTEQWRQFGEKMLETQSNLTAAWMKAMNTGGSSDK